MKRFVEEWIAVRRHFFQNALRTGSTRIIPFE
jgi:hypothetical protein